MHAHNSGTVTRNIHVCMNARSAFIAALQNIYQLLLEHLGITTDIPALAELLQVIYLHNNSDTQRYEFDV